MSQHNLLSHDDRAYHFGFSLGVNKMDFALKPDFELKEFDYTLPEPANGFHIGIVSNLKLAPLYDLRFIPTLSFGERHIYYHDRGFVRDQPSLDGKYDPTLLEFPLHLKFKSVRIVNTRFYVIGGFKYSHDLGTKEGKDLTDGEFPVVVAANDFHYEMGVGIDHYFYYFKFSAEIKASFGMRNLAKEGNMPIEFFSSIDRLNSKSIMISFLFE